MPRALARRMISTERAALTCATCTRPPVSSARSASRATITDSAASGIPLRPMRVETQPSCMTPDPFRSGSSACWITGILSSRVSSSARRMISAFRTGFPSSEIATAPASTRSSISVSCSPSWPRVTAAIGKTRARPTSRARRTTYSTRGRSSRGGSVFGMQATAVNPPRAAARVPVSIVSFSSWPGSRRWTWMSTKPGQTTAPRTSTISTSGRERRAAGASSPHPAIRPWSIQRSCDRSIPREGSRTLPPRRQSGLVMTLLGLHGRGFGDRFRGGVAPREEIEDGHPDGDAVRDLLQDDRVLPVGDILGDLDAAVHGTWVHHGDVGLRAAEPLARHAVDPRVFAKRGIEASALSLQLNPEDVDHVGSLDRLLDALRDADPEALDLRRHHRGRPRDGDLGAELRQPPDVRARDAAVHDVAHDRDVKPRDSPALLPHREDVEESLGRVFVRAVARVDDPGLEMPGQIVRRAGGLVPDHHQVNPHRLDVPGRIAEGLALGDAGTARLEAHGVGAQALLRQLEGETRARARLEEEVGGGHPAEGRHLGNRAVEDLAERPGGIENRDDFLGAQVLEAEQILPMADHDSISPIDTPS